MLTANEIRDSFVKFFESKGHQIVPSAPMVIKERFRRRPSWRSNAEAGVEAVSIT